jgi:ABC-type transporter Mla MlaB component
MVTESNTVTETLNGVMEEFGVQLNFTPSKRKKTKKINICIEGSFNLTSSNFVKKKIGLVLTDYDIIDISLKNIKQIDLSAIQLLYYLQQAHEENQKTITVDAELSNEDRLLLFNAGLKKMLTRATLTDK